MHDSSRFIWGAGFRFNTFIARALCYAYFAGRELLEELVKEADVLVESFRPGVMARLGLSYESLSQINPRLIYCSLTGYGQKGHLAHLGGHDLNYQGYAGILPRRVKDGRAVIPQTLTSDLAGGSYSCALAILSALLKRHTSQEGSYIDLSITDSSLMFLPLEAALVAQGCEPADLGTDRLNGGHPCYDLYDTSDGKQITFAALEHKFWVSFCQQAQCEFLLEEVDLTQPEAAQRVRAELSRIFAQRTQAEWVALGEAWDVCLGPVWTPAEALQHATEREAPIWRQVQTPSKELVSVLRGGGANGASSTEPDQDATALPHQGQHTQELIAALGKSSVQIDELMAKGVLINFS